MKKYVPTINIYDPDVNYLQVYVLDYYGILVAFQVCKVLPETIRLVELEMRQHEDGWMLYDDLRLAKHPWFVKKNVFTKSEYEVVPIEDGLIPIEVEYTSPIFNEAMRLGIEAPLVGTFYAERQEEYRNIYWISNFTKNIC